MAGASPLTITCQNPRCGKEKVVKSRFEQRRQKYCSARCRAVMCMHSRPFTKAERALASSRSIATRQRKVRERLAGLTVEQAFRLGYQLGVKSKLRYIRKHYRLEKVA